MVTVLVARLFEKKDRKVGSTFQKKNKINLKKSNRKNIGRNI